MLPKVVSLIDKRQHGFLPNRSCATNLTILIDDVYFFYLKLSNQINTLYFTKDFMFLTP